MYKYKDFMVEYKEAPDGKEGMISGYCSTWIERPDAYGDVVKKGAFAECLADIEASHKTVPFIWSHKLDDLDAYLGKVSVLREDDHGLYFEAELDDTPQAQKVRRMFKDGRLTKFSFAYDTLEEGPVTLSNGVKANELRKLYLYEVSAVLIPANDDASVTDVKSDESKESDDSREKKDADNAPEAKDQALLNLEKFELLQLIKKYERK